jgi:uncharacterized protein YaeQ
LAPATSCATLGAMARSATIYRARLELSHVDRNVYESLQLTIARHPSETMERTVMRLLAFGLRYDEGLEFGRGVSATDEPDLWRREGDGRVIDWIEVGQPDAKRLIKAARQSARCELFVFGNGSDRWRKAHLDGLAAPENLGVARIEDRFVDAVAATAERQLEWSMTIAEGTIFLTTGDVSFETSPEIWLNDPLG